MRSRVYVRCEIRSRTAWCALNPFAPSQRSDSGPQLVRSEYDRFANDFRRSSCRPVATQYFPGETPDYTSLESYLTANVLIEGLRRAGPQLDTETLVDALEGLRDFDMGLGPRVSFGPAEHQAVHKVWGTQLDPSGQYHAIDLE